MKLKDLPNYKELLLKYEEKDNIYGTFNLCDLELTSLDGCLKNIMGTFYCTGNKFKNPIKEIIENQIKAEKYLTDVGFFKYTDIKGSFERYGKTLLKKESIKNNKKIINKIDYGLGI